MHNINLREAMRNKGIFNYQVAAEMGIAETSFSRMLARSELTEEKQAEVLSAIQRIDEARRERY